MHLSKRHGGFRKLDFFAFCHQDFLHKLGVELFRTTKYVLAICYCHSVFGGEKFNIEIFVGQPFRMQMEIP